MAKVEQARHWCPDSSRLEGRAKYHERTRELGQDVEGGGLEKRHRGGQHEVLCDTRVESVCVHSGARERRDGWLHEACSSAGDEAGGGGWLGGRGEVRVMVCVFYEVGIEREERVTTPDDDGLQQLPTVCQR